MKITANGVYDLPMRLYRGQPADALSLSASDAIKLMESTPLHLRQSWLEPEKRDHRANMGTAIHCLLLEPLRKGAAIKVIEAPDFKTKAAREAADEALDAGMVPLLVETFERAMTAVDAVRSHQGAAELLDSGIPEQCYFAKHQSGVYVKARPDLVNGAGIIVDIKSVGDANPEFIRRRIYDGSWYTQSVFHCDVYERVTGRQPADYLWICVEQKPPHAVAVYRPSRDAMVAGARKNAAAIETFAECARTGVWPGYPTGVRELGLPDFAHYKLEEEALNGDEE